MKNHYLKYCLLSIFMILVPSVTYAQVVRGVIKDKSTGELLFGVSIVEKGTSNAVTSDFDGQFQIKPSKGFPVTLVISMIGFKRQEVVVKDNKDIIKINFESEDIQIGDANVTADRISEKQKEAPLTIESMDAIAIKQTSSVSFYEGLGNLKGVDLTSASIGFKVINTRGFNSTSPVRSLQLIDGVDNQSPGLNFSLGNFLGASELDIQKVDLIQGASSSFYGPNAFNGVISMTTKSPFDFPGLSAQVKVGERGLFEGALRWAQKFKDKKGYDRFAYKVNFYYLRANDWEAVNYDPATDSRAGIGNPGGYDKVNVYGDEALAQGYDYYTDSSARRLYPGLGIFYRDGYREIDLVDYNSENIKANVALHYKTRKNMELILSSNFGYGTTVYQGENRFSLRNVQFFQNRLEFRKKDKFFIRFYATNEDAGNSYDAVVTAFLLQNNNKPLAPQENIFTSWNIDYASWWQFNIVNNGYLYSVIPGFPTPQPGQPYNYALADSLLTVYYDSLVVWHQRARDFANDSVNLNGFNPYGLHPYFPAGTYEFDTAFAGITSRPLGQGGSKFVDRSALFHLHGEYKFRIKTVDFTVGGNGRLYAPNSQGTIFADTNGRRIYNWEIGAYVGVEKRWEKIKVSATLRVDKNQNFNFLFSPAASAVFTPHKNHTIRLSFASAIRNPTLSDQYLLYNVGRATLRGNLTGYDSLVTLESLQDYLLTLDPAVLEYFDVAPVQPEEVRTIEVGYRATLWKRWYIDAGYYFSFYNNFIGYKLGVDLYVDPLTTFPTNRTTAYRVSTNSPDLVTTQGVSVQTSVYFGKYFSVSGNYTWNQLDRRGSTDPIIPAYNTPEHKFNIGVDGRDIKLRIGKLKINNWGFNVNFKWIQGFLFEGSPQFTGYVDSYYMLDAQINYYQPKAHLLFKLGAQNLTNNRAYQVYGGPRVGRMVYFSILFDWDFLKNKNKNK